MTRKIIGIAFAVILLIGAVANLIISGTFAWILIYLVAAILILLAAFGRIPVIFLALACVACFIGAFYVWSEQIDNPQPFEGNIWELEKAREAMSLLGLGAILFLYAILPGRAYPTPSR